MNAIIVDDENKACTNLQKMLQTYIDPSINICGIANSAAEAEALIIAYNPDVVFLDIEMPDENAFEFLDRIASINFEIIFVTAYDEFAVRAFRLNAIYYILKPIRVNDLKSAVERFKERLQYKTLVHLPHISYAELSSQVVNNVRQHSLTLRNTNGIEVLSFRDIYYIEAHGSYSKFVFIKDNNVKEILSSYALSYYEELLPANIFFRIHRSYILNCQHLKSVNETGMAVINEHIMLPVGRRRFSLLLDFLKQNNMIE
jgi:two-component system LytT family response regulator